MINKLIRRINMTLLNFLILFAVLSVTAYLFILRKQFAAALASLLILVIITAINISIYFIKQRQRARRVKALSFMADSATGQTVGSVRDFKLPLAFLSGDGAFMWANDLFCDIFNDRNAMLSALKQLYIVNLRGKIDNRDINLSMEVEFEERTFYMMTNVVRAEKSGADSFVIMMYFTETTDLISLRTHFENRRTAIGEIAIDSYEEIYQSSGDAIVNEIAVELSKLFDKWLSGRNAVIKRLVRDRYILIIEDDALNEMMRDKFSILDMAKKISVGNRIPVTLSIGIGAHGDSANENYKAASGALELALSRGGDQAVVRADSSDSYYGGSNIELESITKVKARVIATLFKDEIVKSSRVLIMGHQVADMDSLGSALCVYRACCALQVDAKIIINDTNPAIAAIMAGLQARSEYSEVFINTSYALNLIDDDTLAVVVDTSRQSMTECPKLLDYASRVAVFDHHRKASDYLKDTVLDYSETYASSTSELLIEVLRYMIPNAAIPAIEAEAMYAGILVDTKNFTFKTGSRTFEVASYLRSQGVDTVGVRQYFQPDMETYSLVARITASAHLISGRIAMAHCPSSTRNQKLVTALAADHLLNIAGVDASFVLCDTGGQIAVSARSLGEINVQVILEKVGGGGHLTAAAAVIKDVSLEFAEKELMRHISEYLEK